MDHPRSAIRAAVRDRLAAALPDLAARIYVQRATPLVRERLPAIMIYARDERIDEAYTADPGARRRVLTLAVEIVAAGRDAHDAADALAAAVESALEADETLGGLLEGSRLMRTEMEMDGDGETPIFACRLLIEAVYWTLWRQPDAGARPTLVLYSIAPEIGAAHVDRYRTL